ncbi:MAG: biotin--[acetyl-CoA-carboxylase] ligase [Bdellovibrionales bacterium]|nr:biotin--[acetyl-CoA-carboxylase] ligase [Bdellovibrionales bacterium]
MSLNLKASRFPELSTQYLGKPFFHVNTTESTQTLLKTLLQEGHQEGTAVLCDHQIQGKGSRGRKWFNLPKPQIYLSIALTQEMFAPTPISALNIALGIVMVNIIRHFGIQSCYLKWPNDIYIHQRKLCGILSDLVQLKPHRTFIASGIGLNYEGTPEEFPDELKETGTVLSEHLAPLPSRFELIASYLHELEVYLKLLQKDGETRLVSDFERLWIFKDKVIQIQLDGTLFEGLANTIDRNGALLLETPNKMLKIYSGEILMTKTID